MKLKCFEEQATRSAAKAAARERHEVWERAFFASLGVGAGIVRPAEDTVGEVAEIRVLIAKHVANEAVAEVMRRREALRKEHGE